MEAVATVTPYRDNIEARALAPLHGVSRGYVVLVAVLIAILGWGAFAYSVQLREGLYATGMRDRIMWGLYIALFVFFVGASMGGTFVSAILRLTRAEWRAPITRGAEFMTVSALISAAFIITVNISQIGRYQNIFLFGRWESQLIWDLFGLSTYLVGSLIYLYLALIPDIALIRDRFGTVFSPGRSGFYRFLAVGWTGQPGQARALASGLTLITIVIVPVAIMMHTVTSWIFGMTLREPWNNPMFGVYFVGGAIYSGVGLIIILMAVMRHAYGLQQWIGKRHFLNLGYMLAALAAVMIFFQVSEFVTTGYKVAASSSFNIQQMVSGALAPIFWTYLWLGLVAPIALITIPWTRRMEGIIAAAVLANIGMFLERYFIVVGGLRVPLNPYEPAEYSPTWVEWSMMLAVAALFVLVIAIMSKVFPPVSVSEIREAQHASQSGETS